MPGGVHTDAHRSDPHRALHQGQPRAPSVARAHQFVRLRRHELQPDFRPGRMKCRGLHRRHRRAGPGSRQLGRGRARCCRADSRTMRRTPTVLPIPAMLPPAERRRTGRVGQSWRLAVASEADRRTPAMEPAEIAQRIFFIWRRRAKLPRTLPGAGAADAARFRRPASPIRFTTPRPAIGASRPAPWPGIQRAVRFRRKLWCRPARGA